MTDRDPTRIRSIAVHREDVVTALEATLRTDRHVVLRITPPFSGRMRARIHETNCRLDPRGTDDRKQAEGTDDRKLAEGMDDRKQAEGTDDRTVPIHIDSRDLVDGVPPYPEVDETAAAHPEPDIETRRARHADAVDEWRRAARRSLVESVTVDVGGEERRIDVVPLG